MVGGISEAILPRKVVQTEIGNIQKLGVEIKLNSPVGKNGFTLDNLKRQGYKATFIAAGAHKNAKGEVPHLSFLDPNKYEMTPKNRIKVNPHTMATNVDGVFAGGDVASGQASVIRAIAAGQRAATSIDRYLRRENLDYRQESPGRVRLDDVEINDVRKQSIQVPRRPSGDDKTSGSETEDFGPRERQALAEAGRCLNCRLRPRLPEMETPES